MEIMMANRTIDSLMREVNCVKFPERWREIYNEAMAEYDRYGCPQTDPAYYDALGDRYGILMQYRDVYKRAAEEVGKNESLSRFLALLVRALKDREFVSEDLKQFKAPSSPSGEHAIEYDMLTGLAICSLVPYSFELLKARGLPSDVIRAILSLPEKGIPEYRKRNGGADGYHLLEWFQRAIEGRLVRIGRLEIETFAAFKVHAAVFRNRNGETVSLADDLMLHRDGFALGAAGYRDETEAYHAEIIETDDVFFGHPFLENGFVSRDTVTLRKDEWEKVLVYDDPVVSLHIPADGSLSEQVVDETLAETKEFLARYYPDFNYKAFYCGSWLLDPQLEQMLGESSNIVKFGKRFQRYTAKSGGEAVFNFVFRKPNMEFELSELPEDTRLERALKAHYLDGKYIYEMRGHFFL